MLGLRISPLGVFRAALCQTCTGVFIMLPWRPLLCPRRPKHFPPARQVLQHFHMPPAVVRLLCSFYDGQERLLRHTGSCAGTWIQATWGAAQRCPLSPIIAPAVMAAWSRVVGGPQVDGLSFHDHRTVLARSRLLSHAVQCLLLVSVPPSASRVTLPNPPWSAPWPCVCFAALLVWRGSFCRGCCRPMRSGQG